MHNNEGGNNYSITTENDIAKNINDNNGRHQRQYQQRWQDSATWMTTNDYNNKVIRSHQWQTGLVLIWIFHVNKDQMVLTALVLDTCSLYLQSWFILFSWFFVFHISTPSSPEKPYSFLLCSFQTFVCLLQNNFYVENLAAIT